MLTLGRGNMKMVDRDATNLKMEVKKQNETKTSVDNCGSVDLLSRRCINIGN